MQPALLLLLLLSAFSALVVSNSQAQTLKVSTGEWAPLISSEVANDGPISQVVKEAFALSGIPVELNYHPWKRAMEEVRLKRVDAGFAWRKTAARTREFLYSEEIYEGVNVFFHLKSVPFQWQQMEDLESYRLGGALGYAYSQAFDDAEKSGTFEVFRVNDEASLVGLLLSRRIDVFPANREVIRHILKQQYPNQLEQIVFHPLPLTRKPLHLIAMPTDAGHELIKQLNLGLNRLKSSGRFQQIYRAHND